MVTQTSHKRGLRILFELSRKPYIMRAEEVAEELCYDPAEANSLFLDAMAEGRLEVTSESYDENDKVDVVRVRLPRLGSGNPASAVNRPA